MTFQVINLGITPNSNTGDPLRIALTKVNDNFAEVYDILVGQTAGSNAPGFIKYSGAIKTPGQFYGGTDIPVATTRLNFDGHFYATRFYGDGSNLSNVAAVTATTATTLQTARTINGTSFDGSANITTTSWGTSRTITIGNTGKSVDGAGNVFWTIAEIGALPLTGGTLTGTSTISTSSWSKWVLDTTGITAKARQGSDSNGLNFTTNAQWTGSAWAEDDTTKKKFAYIQHLGNGRHEFRTAASGTGVSWVSSLIADEAGVGVTGTLSATGAITQNGNQVLHAANYTSYAPSLTGTGASGSWSISVTGNAGTAAAWQTARSLTIGNTPKTVDGSGNVTWTLGEIGAVPLTGGTMTGALTVPSSFTVNAEGTEGGQIVLKRGTDQLGLSGDVVFDTLGNTFRFFENGGVYRQFVFDLTNGNITGAGGITPSISGNAATATTLQNARTINGTSFNGSANITTNSWGTARTITIGNTGKSVDGSGNVSWTRAEMLGAAPASGAWFSNSPPNVGSDGVMEIGRYIDFHNANAGTTDFDVRIDVTAANAISFIGGTAATTVTAGTFSGALSGNATTATTLQTARNINGVSFNGSADITIADSTKLPLTGGSLTGVLNTSATSLAINTTTPGTGTYHLNFTGQGTADNAHGITWGWSSSGAQAGIYVQSSGNYGTKMYIATTDSFATGSKTAISIDHSGNTTINRGTFQTGSVWINNGVNNNAYNENIRLFNAPNGVSVIAFSASGVSGTPTTSILGYSDRQEIRFNDGWQQRVYNGYAEASGSYRAPIFYDSNDTNYYTDPASTSRVNNIRPTVISRADHAQGFLEGSYNNVGSNDAKTNPIYTIGSSYNPTNTSFSNMYGIGYSHPNMWGSGKSGGWGLYVVSNGTVKGTFGGESDPNTWISGYGISDSSWRAPIFYDSNNTGYYTDPASTSSLNALTLAGRVTTMTPTNYTAITSTTYNTAPFEIPNLSVPNSGTNFVPFLHGSTVLTGAGYVGHVTFGALRVGSSNFTNAGAFLALSQNDAYPTEYFTFQTGGLIGHSIGYLTIPGSARSPIFYDSDNTGYYVDPAGSARLNEIYGNNVYLDLGGWFRAYGATGLYSQSYGNHFYATSDAYWNIAGNNGSVSALLFRTGGHQGTVRGYVYADSSNNIGFLNSGGSWRLRVVGDDYTLSEGSSIRGQLFYDSNNTGYYWDGASTSKWNESNQDGWHTFNNYGLGVTGTYASTRLQTVFAMGSSYRMAADGTATNDMYGIAWSHPNAGSLGGANNLNDHGILIINNGTFRAALSSRAVFSADVRGTLYYDYNDTGYYLDPNSTSNSALRIRGGTLYGPNPTWGAYLYVGSNGNVDVNTATVAATNGNLHLDAANGYVMYLNNYATSSYTIAAQSMRSPIFYDSNDTGYYCDPSSVSYLYGLTLAGGSYFRPQNWIQLDSSYGLYWPNHYGAHLHANDLSTYTQIALRGGKNSYGGIYDQYSAVNGMMYDSSGNGGVYREANGRWYTYYHLGNDCLGIGTSSTNSAYGIYCGKGLYAGGRVDGTIFYDANDTDGQIDPVGHSRLKTAGHASSGNVSALEIKNTGGTGDGDVAAISWHCSGQYGLQMHLRHDGYFGIGGWSASSWRWYVNNTNGDMTAAGNVTAYSDPRLKEEVTPIASALEKVKQLNGVHFRWKDISELGKPGSYDYGVLATDVEKIAPELVCESAITSPDGDRYKTVAYDKLAPFLIEAVKEQQKIIDAQEERINRLEKLVEKLTQ